MVDKSIRRESLSKEPLTTQLFNLSTQKCGWRDSNPHASRRQILSLIRLPISPHPRSQSEVLSQARMLLNPDYQLPTPLKGLQIYGIFIKLLIRYLVKIKLFKWCKFVTNGNRSAEAEV